MLAALPGMNPQYLDELPAAEVPAYGIVACERDAMQIERMISAFLIPGQSFSGEAGAFKALAEESRRLRGLSGDDEATSAFLAREKELVAQLNAAAAAGDEELMADLERAYREEVAARDEQEMAAIRKRLKESTVTVSPAVLAATKEFVS